MEESLIEDEYLSIEERSLLPKVEFFVPNSIREIEKEREFEERVSGHEHVMLADGDADGLACVVLGKRAFGDLSYAYTSPNELSEALERLVDDVEEGGTVFVVDLALDSLDEDDAIYPTLEELTEKADVYWYDHHQWDEKTVESLGALGVEVVIGESGEVCSADVTLDELEKMGHNFDDAMRELVKVTRDHDLWIKEDPRSDDLADLSVYLDPDEYIEAVFEGVELTNEYKEYLEEKREEKNQLIKLAVDRAEFEEIEGITVAHTYGRCSQNEVSEELRQKGADAVIVVKPEGGTSLRGSENFEECHRVARLLNGGGHPRAAGCKPDVFDTMLDYADHWVSEGKRARREVLEAFKDLRETGS